MYSQRPLPERPPKSSWWRPRHGHKGSRSIVFDLFSESPVAKRHLKSGTALSLESSSQFSQ
eukprot:3942214-Pyramimonas_sp.AAC.1